MTVLMLNRVLYALVVVVVLLHSSSCCANAVRLHTCSNATLGGVDCTQAVTRLPGYNSSDHGTPVSATLKAFNIDALQGNALHMTIDLPSRNGLYPELQNSWNPHRVDVTIKLNENVILHEGYARRIYMYATYHCNTTCAAFEGGTPTEDNFYFWPQIPQVNGDWEEAQVDPYEAELLDTYTFHESRILEFRPETGRTMSASIVSAVLDGEPHNGCECGHLPDDHKQYSIVLVQDPNNPTEEMDVEISVTAGSMCGDLHGAWYMHFGVNYYGEWEDTCFCSLVRDVIKPINNCGNNVDVGEPQSRCCVVAEVLAESLRPIGSPDDFRDGQSEGTLTSEYALSDVLAAYAQVDGNDTTYESVASTIYYAFNPTGIAYSDFLSPFDLGVSVVSGDEALCENGTEFEMHVKYTCYEDYSDRFPDAVHDPLPNNCTIAHWETARVMTSTQSNMQYVIRHDDYMATDLYETCGCDSTPTDPDRPYRNMRTFVVALTGLSVGCLEASNVTMEVLEPNWLCGDLSQYMMDCCGNEVDPSIMIFSDGWQNEQCQDEACFPNALGITSLDNDEGLALLASEMPKYFCNSCGGSMSTMGCEYFDEDTEWIQAGGSTCEIRVGQQCQYEAYTHNFPGSTYAHVTNYPSWPHTMVIEPGETKYINFRYDIFLEFQHLTDPSDATMNYWMPESVFMNMSNVAMAFGCNGAEHPCHELEFNIRYDCNPFPSSRTGYPYYEDVPFFAYDMCKAGADKDFNLLSTFRLDSLPGSPEYGTVMHLHGSHIGTDRYNLEGTDLYVLSNHSFYPTYNHHTTYMSEIKECNCHSDTNQDGLAYIIVEVTHLNTHNSMVGDRSVNLTWDAAANMDNLVADGSTCRGAVESFDMIDLSPFGRHYDLDYAMVIPQCTCEQAAFGTQCEPLLPRNILEEFFSQTSFHLENNDDYLSNEIPHMMKIQLSDTNEGFRIHLRMVLPGFDDTMENNGWGDVPLSSISEEVHVERLTRVHMLLSVEDYAAYYLNMNNNATQIEEFLHYHYDDPVNDRFLSPAYGALYRPYLLDFSEIPEGTLHLTTEFWLPDAENTVEWWVFEEETTALLKTIKQNEFCYITLITDGWMENVELTGKVRTFVGDIEFEVNDSSGYVAAILALMSLGTFFFCVGYVCVTRSRKYGFKKYVHDELLGIKDKEIEDKLAHVRRQSIEKAKKLRAALVKAQKEEEAKQGKQDKKKDKKETSLYLLGLYMCIAIVISTIIGMFIAMFNISLIHNSISDIQLVTLTSVDELKDIIYKAFAEDLQFRVFYDFYVIFAELFGQFDELASIGLEWNCGGAISMFAPVALLLGIVFLLFILQRDLLLAAAISLQGETESVFRKALATGVAHAAIYALQAAIVSLTKVVYATWAIQRSCNEFDLGLVTVGYYVCIFMIVVFVYITVLLFSGLKELTIRSLTVGWINGAFALLQISLGIWRESTIKQFRIIERAALFDDNDKDDDNQQQTVMSLTAQSRGLVWLPAFGIGIILTKAAQALNDPPFVIFYHNDEGKQQQGKRLLLADTALERGFKFFSKLATFILTLVVVWKANKSSVTLLGYSVLINSIITYGFVFLKVVGKRRGWTWLDVSLVATRTDATAEVEMADLSSDVELEDAHAEESKDEFTDVYSGTPMTALPVPIFNSDDSDVEGDTSSKKRETSLQQSDSSFQSVVVVHYSPELADEEANSAPSQQRAMQVDSAVTTPRQEPEQLEDIHLEDSKEREESASVMVSAVLASESRQPAQERVSLSEFEVVHETKTETTNEEETNTK